MAQIKNKKKYPLITPKDKDFLVATQESTGKTRSISVGDLSQHIIDKIPTGGVEPPITKIKFKEDILPIVDKTVEIPSDLSEFNDKDGIIPDVSKFQTEEQVDNKIHDYSIKDVKTISDLRLLEGKEGQEVRLLGYYELGDKPPLLYKWVSGNGKDDGGSIIVSNGGYWSALFRDVVDVRHFGAKDDYVDINNYTDNKYFFDKAIEYMLSNNTRAQLLTNINTLLIPFTKNLGYGVNGSINFGGGYSIIMESYIISANNDKEYFIKIGGDDISSRAVFRYQNYKIRCRPAVIDWYDTLNKNIGVIVQNVQRATIEINSVFGFNVGFMPTGMNAGFYANTIYINELLNNRVNCYLYSESIGGASNGYVTSNFFHVNRIGNDLSVGSKDYDKIGILIDNKEGGYVAESNTFICGVIEGSDTIGKYTPILIKKGNLNTFENFRHESNGLVFAVVENGYGNKFDITISEIKEENHNVNKDYDINKCLVDKTANKDNYIYSRYDNYKGITIYDSGSLINKASFFNNDEVSVKGIGCASFNYQTKINLSKSITVPNISEKGLHIPKGQGLFVDIFISDRDIITVDVNDYKDNRIKCYYYALDKDNNVIEDGVGGILQSTTQFGNLTKTDYYSSYDRHNKRNIFKNKDNVYKIRVIFSNDKDYNGNNGEGILKSFKIKSLNGKSLNVSEYQNYTNKQALIKPTKFNYIKGEIVYNYDLTSNIYAWQALSSGDASTIQWRELKNNTAL